MVKKSNYFSIGTPIPKVETKVEKETKEFNNRKYNIEREKKEFNLSEKIDEKEQCIEVFDVKEFIKLLKEEIGVWGKIPNHKVIDKIDKLAGEKLI